MQIDHTIAAAHIFKEAIRLRLKGSLYEFVKYFWDVVISDEYIDNWHIKYICNELQIVGGWLINREPKQYDLVINVPPGTSKSTVCTVMFPVWLWINDPSLKIITNSYSHDLSLSHTLKSRDIILSDKFKSLFDIKLRQDKSGKSNYENTSHGERITTSTSSTITGKHAHVIITDDPINPSQALSDKERLNAINHMTSTLETRTTNPELTPFIIVMQRLHENDVTGYVLQNYDRVKHICLPAELTQDVKPEECRDFYCDGLFDIRRFPKHVLEQKKKRLGTMQYAGQFLQTPVSSEAALFKMENNKYCDYDVMNKCIITADNRVDLRQCITLFTIDLAITVNNNSDYTVISYYAIDKQNNLYLLDCYRNRVEGADHVNLIQQWYNRYIPDVVGIESVAYQQTLCQEMKRKGLNVKELKPDKDKITRSWAAATKHENGTIYFNRNINSLSDIENEMAMFPSGEHDDFVDTLSYAVEYLNNNVVSKFRMIDPNILKSVKDRKSPSKAVKI